MHMAVRGVAGGDAIFVRRNSWTRVISKRQCSGSLHFLPWPSSARRAAVCRTGRDLLLSADTVRRVWVCQWVQGMIERCTFVQSCEVVSVIKARTERCVAADVLRCGFAGLWCRSLFLLCLSLAVTFLRADSFFVSSPESGSWTTVSAFVGSLLIAKARDHSLVLGHDSLLKD